MTFLFSSSKTPISDELLSAYSDAEVTSAEKQRVEQALRTQPELRQRLAELRVTVDLLAHMEPVAVPRAFVLSEAQVQASGRRIFFSPHLWSLLLPRLLPLATAAVAVALVVVLGLDMAGMNTAPALSPELAAIAVEAEPSALGLPEPQALQAQDETPPAAPAADALRAQALTEAITTTVEAQVVAAAPAAEEAAAPVTTAAGQSTSPLTDQKTLAPAAPEPERRTASPIMTLSQVKWLLGGLLLVLASLTWWLRRRYRVG